MRLVMLLAADYAVVDASGKLNILGAFTTINAYKFPVQHPSMHLVIKLQPELGEYNETRLLRVVLADEDGNELIQLAHEFRIPEGKSGRRPEFNSVIGLQNLEFPRPGTYEFRVYVDKDQKDSLPIQLVQLDRPEE